MSAVKPVGCAREWVSPCVPSPVRRRRAARDGWVTLLAVALLLTLAGCAGREMTRVSTPAPATPEVLPAAPEEDVRSASRSVEPISRERTVAVDHSAAASDASDLLRGPSAGEATIRTGGGHSTVEELLAAGLHLAGASPVHLAIRGTAGAATVRCAWRGIARTAAQREDRNPVLAADWMRATLIPERSSIVEALVHGDIPRHAQPRVPGDGEVQLPGDRAGRAVGGVPVPDVLRGLHGVQLPAGGRAYDGHGDGGL